MHQTRQISCLECIFIETFHRTSDVFNLFKEGRGERYLKPGGASDKEPICQCRRHETWDWSLGWGDTLEEGMATHSNILAHRTEELGGLQSTGLQRIRHNWGDLARTHTHALNERMVNVMLFYANEFVFCRRFSNFDWVIAGIHIDSPKFPCKLNGTQNIFVGLVPGLNFWGL